MKKLTLLLILFMLLGLVACSGESDRGWFPNADEITPEELQEEAYYYGRHPEEGDIFLWATRLYAVNAREEVKLLDDRTIMVMEMEFSHHDVETGKLYENKLLVLKTSGKLCIYDGAEWVQISGQDGKENSPTVPVPEVPVPVLPTPGA